MSEHTPTPEDDLCLEETVSDMVKGLIADTDRLRAVNKELVDIIENISAARAYVAGLGASEWESTLTPREVVALAKAETANE